MLLIFVIWMYSVFDMFFFRLKESGKSQIGPIDAFEEPTLQSDRHELLREQHKAIRRLETKMQRSHFVGKIKRNLI